jgi:uroporphyrinogen-III synthase
VIPKRIFISRPITEVGETLKNFAAIGGELIAESLLKFESVHFQHDGTYEVIFFSSIRSADFFLSQHPRIPVSVKYACAGPETAEKLVVNYQISCDFISLSAGNPSESAQLFKTWLGKRQVLFPMSVQSLNTYSSVLPIDQKTEIIVYRTNSIPKPISPCDLYIFSSPSNVTAFLENNELPRSAKCIAWGSSTRKSLEAQQIAVFHHLNTGTLYELDVFLSELFTPNSVADGI